MSKITQHLSVLLADTYNLYLKTQNYHWHVTGINFKSLHDLFEGQYLELAQAVDDIAERIRTLGEKAPASFQEFLELTTLKPGDSKTPAKAMLDDLINDHKQVLTKLYQLNGESDDKHDEGSAVLISDRIAHHEKTVWMLQAHKD